MTYEDALKIYNSFINIEEQYLDSGLTREEFITKKLGGDITIGIMLLTDALSKACNEDDRVIDILSEIRIFFNFIQKHSRHLNLLPSFDYAVTAEDGFGTDIITELIKTESVQPYIQILTQSELYGKTNNCHYYIDSDNYMCCPLQLCDVVHTFNKSTIDILSCLYNVNTKNLKTEKDIYYKHNKRGLKKITEAEAKEFLNASVQ